MKLIPLDAVLAEIEKLKAEALQKKSQCKRSGLEKIMHQIGAYNKVLSFIDTLEVKEVDLEKEKDDYWNKLCDSEFGELLERDAKWFDDIAKHFFELGARIKKEEKYEIPSVSKTEDVSVTSRMAMIDNDLKSIAEFILACAHWNLHKDEWNHPVLEVPLFRVLDTLIQRGNPYCGKD